MAGLVDDKKFKPDEQLTKFPAPTCYIIYSYGKYSNDFVSFGARVNTPSSSDDQPIIELVGNGQDYPICWKNKSRTDNVWEPNKSMLLSVNDWEGLDGIFKPRIGTTRGVMKKIIDDFKAKFDVTLRKRIIYEESEKRAKDL